MMTTVAGNDNAIGYVSLGSLNDSVKALSIDGVEASAENIKNGTYAVARPFNIATGKEVSEVTQDFINFILSEDGRQLLRKTDTSVRAIRVHSKAPSRRQNRCGRFFFRNPCDGKAEGGIPCHQPQCND